MAQFSGTVLTKQGLQLQSKAQIGTKLEFTNVKLGDGKLAEGQSLEDLTGLIKPMLTLGIQFMDVIGDGTSRVRVVLTNQGLEQGFFVREIGVYAKDPQLGEILYSVAYADEMADFLPAGGGVSVVEQVLDLITVVGNAQNVTAVIDKHTMIATLEDLDEHNGDPNAHDAKINAKTVGGKYAADFAGANISVPLTAGKWNLVLGGTGRTFLDFHYHHDAAHDPINVRGSFIGSNSGTVPILKYDTYSWNKIEKLEIKVLDTGDTRRIYFKPVYPSYLIVNPNYTYGKLYIPPIIDLADNDTSGLNYVCKEGGSFINGNRITTLGDFTQSLAETGWTKLPNGLVIQWGLGVSNSNYGIKTVTRANINFPVAFNKILRWFSTVHNCDSDFNEVEPYTATCLMKNITNTKFDGQLTRVSSCGTFQQHYLAIGY